MAKYVRHYASEILQLPTREERNAALQKVPEQLKASVKKVVTEQFARKKSYRDFIEAIRQQGRSARQMGLSKNECPFEQLGGEQRNTWLQGWQQEDDAIREQLGK